MRILITGSRGFIGQALVGELARKGHEVLRLSTGPLDPADSRLFHWDPAAGRMDDASLDKVDAVIHLAGESIAGARWSDAQKKKILDSRVQGSRLLLDRIAVLPVKPKAFLAASAIGFYGDCGSEALDEGSAPGSDYLAQVVQAWEAETVRAAGLGLRLAQLRFGVVLGQEGGALAKMLTPFKLGLGGVIGSGKQVMSWITIKDLVKAILFVLEKEGASGVYNLTAPQPLSNTEFTKSLGRALHRPVLFPVPAFAARLAFGEMADALLLGGQNVQPKRLIEAGFNWDAPRLDEGFAQIFGRG